MLVIAFLEEHVNVEKQRVKILTQKPKYLLLKELNIKLLFFLLSKHNFIYNLLKTSFAMKQFQFIQVKKNSEIFTI